MTLRQAPHRLLDLLHVAQAQGLIQHYTLKHAVWSGDYYPKTMIYVQLLRDTSDAKIDELCKHIETHYTIHIWNREYTHKSITLAFTNVDHCVSCTRNTKIDLLTTITPHAKLYSSTES